MRQARPREALWHALIRCNHGANYFIVGRDHADPGNDSTGKPFYGPYHARDLLQCHSAELGLRMVPFRKLVYLPDEERYQEGSRLPTTARTASVSGTQVREQYQNQGRKLPSWFTRPGVAEILAETYSPRHHQGVCLWFTGLSGAGKSTTAEVLTVLRLERGRQVTLLDGNVVRTHLSKGPRFSEEDRLPISDASVLSPQRSSGMVGYHLYGGESVPSCTQRRANLVGSERFVEMFVDTPLEVCEGATPKACMSKHGAGKLKILRVLTIPTSYRRTRSSRSIQSRTCPKTTPISFCSTYSSMISCGRRQQ